MSEIENEADLNSLFRSGIKMCSKCSGVDHYRSTCPHLNIDNSADFNSDEAMELSEESYVFEEGKFKVNIKL